MLKAVKATSAWKFDELGSSVAVAGLRVEGLLVLQREVREIGASYLPEKPSRHGEPTSIEFGPTLDPQPKTQNQKPKTLNPLGYIRLRFTGSGLRAEIPWRTPGQEGLRTPRP